MMYQVSVDPVGTDDVNLLTLLLLVVSLLIIV